MRVYSFDWATKKALTVYDSKTEKVKQIPNSIEEFGKFLKKLKKPAIMLIEFGGADTFKIMAFRAGHTILQVAGKKIKDYRDSKGLAKKDDAKIIYDFYMENRGGGGAINILLKDVRPEVPSPLSNKQGGGATSELSKSIKNTMPSPFYLFQEQDASIAELKILFREHEDLKKEMVREKLRRFAFAMKFKIAQVADDRVKKILFHKDIAIAAKEREIDQLKKVLEKKVRQFEIWNNHLKNIKAVGPIITAGLIGELGGRQFENDESLKHYAGMVPKNEFHDYNRYVKVVLYHFAEHVIKNRTLKWRELYDDMKVFYASKHPDWSKGKVNNYAKKFIETKFLLEFWEKWRECYAKVA